MSGPADSELDQRIVEEVKAETERFGLNLLVALLEDIDSSPSVDDALARIRAFSPALHAAVSRDVPSQTGTVTDKAAVTQSLKRHLSRLDWGVEFFNKYSEFLERTTWLWGLLSGLAIGGASSPPHPSDLPSASSPSPRTHSPIGTDYYFLDVDDWLWPGADSSLRDALARHPAWANEGDRLWECAIRALQSAPTYAASDHELGRFHPDLVEWIRPAGRRREAGLKFLLLLAAARPPRRPTWGPSELAESWLGIARDSMQHTIDILYDQSGARPRWSHVDSGKPQR